MVAKSEQSINRLIERFVETAHNYNFYQAIRTLDKLSMLLIENGYQGLDIQIEPHLSLDFPSRDIQSIRYNNKESQIIIVATLIGLYGTASPMPTFYTENLIKDYNDGIKSTKQFLDLFHEVLYKKIYNLWSKYRLNMRALEYQHKQSTNRLHSMIGFGDSKISKILPEMKSLSKYVGLLSNNARPLSGLEVLLKDYFEVNLTINPSNKSINSIIEEQRVELGTSNTVLGKSLCLGQQIKGFGSYLKINIFNLNAIQLKEFKAGGNYAKILSFLVGFYCNLPAKCLVKLHLDKNHIEGVQLNSDSWGRLGQSTWFVDGINDEYKTQFF